MKRILAVITLIVAASLGLSGVVLAGSSEPAGYPEPDYLNGVDRLDTADAIDYFSARLDERGPSTSTLTTIGRLHLTRARETGDLAHLQLAEGFLQEALALQADDPGALIAMSAVRHAEHRFDDALELAQAAHSAQPSGSSLSLIGDVLSAMGDYNGAAASYSQAFTQYGTSAALPGLALLAEVEGRPMESVRLLEQAAAGALEVRQVGEPAAWYQERLAGLHFEHGQLDEAEKRYQAALFLQPGSSSATAGLGEIAAARGEYERAIRLLQSTLGPNVAPDVYISLGDLYTLTGRPDLAENHYQEAVASLESTPAEMSDRELAIFYADHDRNIDEALELAQIDFARRQDLHGYEAVAWTLYRAGRYTEAQQINDQALAFGVVDAPLRYHAGLIALALGDHERARLELETALDINPKWNLLHAEHAREVLADLQA